MASFCSSLCARFLLNSGVLDISMQISGQFLKAEAKSKRLSFVNAVFGWEHPTQIVKPLAKKKFSRGSSVYRKFIVIHYKFVYKFCERISG